MNQLSKSSLWAKGRQVGHRKRAKDTEKYRDERCISKTETENECPKDSSNNTSHVFVSTVTCSGVKNTYASGVILIVNQIEKMFTN